MKFMMNGAITLGTLDGANVEIKDLVGDDNIVIFGMDAREVNRLYQTKGYSPKKIYEENSLIKIIVDQLTNGFFDRVSKHEFSEIKDRLLNQDEYFVLKDLMAYHDAQLKLNALYQDKARWASMCLTNIAKSGFFSSDRTIQNYVDDIWHLTEVS